MLLTVVYEPEKELTLSMKSRLLVATTCDRGNHSFIPLYSDLFRYSYDVTAG